MGEVYRARDTKLNRNVALKVLPESFAADAERLARFKREAQTLAALNHPHIAQIHGLEDGSSALALVMELVEGEDLSQRIARGPIPVDDALALASQIAEALEAAHASGIVHRDLKPANIKTRSDGTVKVLDFGLAKALDQAPSPKPQADHSPTITTPAMTQAGLILGTAAYMSPEQAKGKAIDKRADIWAFGVVLYEMLSGRRLFDGDSMAEVLGSVLRQNIDLNTLPPDAPPAVRRLLRRCLERDPKMRLHDIADARIEIRDAMESPDSTDGRSQRPSPRASAVAWLGWGVAVVVAAASGWMLQNRGPDESRPAFRFAIPQPYNRSTNAPAISPDGRHLVYWNEPSTLRIRALDEATARPLEGTEGGREPFWSPDSRSIGFFTPTELKRISVAGGLPETLAAIPQGWATGTWSVNGTILIEVTEAPGNEGWFVLEPSATSLKKIRAFPDNRQVNPDKAFPWFLPDGERFLFTHPLGNVATLQIGSIRSDETRPLVPSDTRAMFVSAGYVLYVRQGTLLAQKFDPKALAMIGEPAAVMDDVAYFSPTGGAFFSASQDGTLVFRRWPGRTQMRWFDRDGRQTGTLLQSDYYEQPAISKDGQRVAVHINDPRKSTPDLWVIDLDRNVPTRLTSAPRSEFVARWSPDGNQLAFAADWEGPPAIYVINASGGEPKVLVPFDRTQQYPGSWTPDGRELVYEKVIDGQSGTDIWAIAVATGERRKILTTEFDEDTPRLSPNGQWLAYASNASGRKEVYLRGYPDSSWQARLSVDGGADPAWRSDGREIFYYEPGGSIMAVPIEPGGTGRPKASVPARLFSIPENTYQVFDVAPGGQKFLLNLAEPGGLSPPDEVVVDWPRLLKK
jgi:serine/threonine protein kinase